MAGGARRKPRLHVSGRRISANSQTGTDPVIYVCIPAHNEASTVGVLLWKTRKAMAEFDRDYRVVVLDDASTDEAGESSA